MYSYLLDFPNPNTICIPLKFRNRIVLISPQSKVSNFLLKLKHSDCHKRPSTQFGMKKAYWGGFDLINSGARGSRGTSVSVAGGALIMGVAWSATPGRARTTFCAWGRRRSTPRQGSGSGRRSRALLRRRRSVAVLNRERKLEITLGNMLMK